MLLIELAAGNTHWFKENVVYMEAFSKSAEKGLFRPTEEVFLLARSLQGYQDCLPNFIHWMKNYHVLVIPDKIYQIAQMPNEVSLRRTLGKLTAFIEEKSLKSFKEAFEGDILIPMDASLEELEKIYNDGGTLQLIPVRISWAEILK